MGLLDIRLSPEMRCLPGNVIGKYEIERNEILVLVTHDHGEDHMGVAARTHLNREVGLNIGEGLSREVGLNTGVDLSHGEPTSLEEDAEEESLSDADIIRGDMVEGPINNGSSNNPHSPSRLLRHSSRPCHNITNLSMAITNHHPNLR